MRLAELAGRRVGVWGHGREGRAAVRAALTARAAGVVVVDAVPPVDLPPGVQAGSDVAELAGCAVVFRSPGISPYREDARALAARTTLTSGTGVALAEFAARDVPTLCVTGTKGKSTTSALAAAVLTAASRPAVHAGNIGTPLLDVLLDDAVAEGTPLVVEVSSYQAAAVEGWSGWGAVTSLAPEHLDWHGDVETYYRDKLHVFAGCGPESVVVSAQARSIAEQHLDPAVLVDPAELVPEARLAGFPLERLSGVHNVANLHVALAACVRMGVDLDRSAEAVRRAVAGFRALPHRLSPVATRDGVTFVDDALSTTPVSVRAAIDAFAGQQVTLIAGGQDRGLDYTDLAAAVVARGGTVQVLTIPDTGARFAADLRAAAAAAGVAAPVTETGSLADAVAEALRTARPGGLVLLSPGAPSYNRFRNYEELARTYEQILLDAGAQRV
ncbi:UDP-N-acetylmuramoyl-L-alanine--D-glutamate ligase [Geodermatophilus obscurus]|uniref:UDP-N-acetylmuramoyl-L-alanine--L-glutamate ligase n=1 Tax=Geodermatophilus obscurus (strain ATCC 25078 / DSM 43160 / JCM 3152 / CCUG 61914 / KCC A-0152 / KCTC 9177 / NBRC 13315 / NRRL B-3577 / G-20) TaxID=526225 RepID=D2S4M7_GEOOG|nr:UDP-N-acetylmuramoyl-L-alanine--D-glutamate ligase [Geodermatophilus obscurus]ADB77177.1 UDP-N-acetylmuramoylalanine/D-glutamate ligase [Geodermatophilus obscurus DSM 43160]